MTFASQQAMPTTANQGSRLTGLLSASTDEIDAGLLVCDHLGRVIAMNHAARRELAIESPLICIDGYLRTDRIEQAQELADALRGATCGRRKLLSLGLHAMTGLFITILPMQWQGEALAMVMIGRRQLCPQLTIELLGNLFDLTASERRVLGNVLAGMRPTAVARRHGVATSTVRTQISSIRSKLGVKSIDEIFMIAARLPPASGALRWASERKEAPPQCFTMSMNQSITQATRRGITLAE